jgi:hypothetical protein
VKEEETTERDKTRRRRRRKRRNFQSLPKNINITEENLEAEPKFFGPEVLTAMVMNSYVIQEKIYVSEEYFASIFKV